MKWSESDIHDLVEKTGKYEFDYTGDITEEYPPFEGTIKLCKGIIKEREDEQEEIV